MNLPDFLVEWPFGEIMVKGHRIGLFDIVAFRKMGYSAEQLHEQFPSLTREVIDKVLAFHDGNRAEVDAYAKRCQDEIDAQRAAAPRKVSYDELRRRYEEKKRAELG